MEADDQALFQTRELAEHMLVRLDQLAILFNDIAKFGIIEPYPTVVPDQQFTAAGSSSSLLPTLSELYMLPVSLPTSAWVV